MLSQLAQVFGQCERWLDKHLKGVERVNVSSTSKAARLLRDDPKGAAISNRICAQIYNTLILAEDIHDGQSMETTSGGLRLLMVDRQHDSISRDIRTIVSFI